MSQVQELFISNSTTSFQRVEILWWRENYAHSSVLRELLINTTAEHNSGQNTKKAGLGRKLEERHKNKIQGHCMAYDNNVKIFRYSFVTCL